MLCWSCQKQIPDAAEFCPHCEAQVEDEPTADEKAAVQQILSSMNPEMLCELRNVIERSATGDEFVNQIMIGDCPKCGSSQTGDCDKDPEIEDPTVARCFACGQMWCPDCGELFSGKPDHDCPVWDELGLDEALE